METGYPKKMRLSSKKDITRLLEKGTVVFKHPFKVYCFPVERREYSSFAIAVPKKIFKRAVARNRIKRLTREAIRHNQEILCNFNADFLFVYVGKEIDEFSSIQQRVIELLGESRRMLEKTLPTDSCMAVADVDKIL